LAASNGAQNFVDQVISENFNPAELIVAKDETVFGRGNTSKPKEYDEDFSGSLSQAGAPIQIKYLNESDIAAIKNTEGIKAVREGIDLNAEYITRPGKKKLVATVSVHDPFRRPELVAGTIPNPLVNNALLLPEAYLNELGFSSAADAIGTSVTIAVRKNADPNDIKNLLERGLPSQSQIDEVTKAQTAEEQFTVAAVLKKPTTTQPGTELYMYIGVTDAHRVNDIATKNTENYRKYTYTFATVKDGEKPEVLKAAQDRLKAKGYVTQSAEDTQAFLTQIISVLQGIVAAFGAIAVIASVFGIVNTMYISVLQRTREIGLMKALGMRKRDIKRLFRFEAAWIGFLGGALGSLLAVVLGTVLNPWITKQLELGDDKLLIFKWQQIVVLIVILMVVATVAGLLPARKAAKLDPIEALRTE
jgi:putative ABC transport system permease protein